MHSLALLRRPVVNWEVVRRAFACAGYVSNGRCRSCLMLRHVREQGTSRTLCGNACSPMENWVQVYDAHPEDVDAVDRCLNCYRILEQRKEEDLGDLGRIAA